MFPFMRCIRAAGLVSWYGWSVISRVSGASSQRHMFQPSNVKPLPSDECPTSCELLFGKLEEPEVGGGKIQHVEVQERGEPKSGTGFIFEWATGALAHSCIYLQRAYGEKSCRIEWTFSNRTLIFEPQSAAVASCSCENVNSATVTLRNDHKHMLPVGRNCGWAHKGGMSIATDKACAPVDGGEQPKNRTDLLNCIKKAHCQIVDNRLQMAVMRDPRDVVVSAYFHIVRHLPEHKQFKFTVDEYAIALLPITCQWMSIRHLLFTELLAANSLAFWYDDARTDPIKWFKSFFSLVGLHMPDTVVTGVASATAQGGQVLGFPSKGIDAHMGGVDATVVDRSFRDEVSAATLAKMDDVMRLWLPTPALKKLGVFVP